MKRGKLFAALLAAAVLMGSPLAGSISEQKASAEEVIVISENGGESQNSQEILSGEVTEDGEVLFAAKAPATTSAAKLNVCRGESTGKIRIQARVSRPVKSKDNYYYLCRVDADGDPETIVQKVKKVKSGTQNLKFILNTDGHPEYVMNRYCIAVKTQKGKKMACYTRISSPKNVETPEKVAANKAKYKVPKTKKGLQTVDIGELTKTKSKTAFCNLQMSTVMTKSAETIPYEYNGKTYYFSQIGGYRLYVSQCNQKGIQVTMQIMLDWTDATKDVIAASSPQAGSSFYAWDALTPASRQKMEAVFAFLGEMFGQDDCYVSNWILGNEVNSCNAWNNPGNMNKTEYVKQYSEAFRCLYNAVRANRSSSKVFMCVDQLWNLRVQGYGAKEIIDGVAGRLKRIQKNVEWNLAYHAYPFPLTDCRFWLSASNPDYGHYMTNSTSSPVVSLNNLSVMTKYIRNKYGSNTRVILSEQGFTSTQSQQDQAAAIALGYYIAACDPMVDAFIIRSYADTADEMAQGLHMGLAGKKAMKVFQYMDSSSSLKYAEKYLKSQVGAGWKSWVPGFSTSKITKTYRKG